MTTHHYDAHGNLILHAMPVMVVALCLLAIAYRFYSAFLAAKVAALDGFRTTPATKYNDGQNYHPTNKWVLFGHHFAAISGAGPLIGPVLAIQYGFVPGLVWLIIGVCLAGAVQDMLVMAASVRHDGKSLAHIAREQLGRTASIIASLAILFIIVIALAGLGFVVVKALGGEDAKLPAGMKIYSQTPLKLPADYPASIEIPPGSFVKYDDKSGWTERSEAFTINAPSTLKTEDPWLGPLHYSLPEKCVQVIPGSSWGTFTIASTIPIALLVGLWMYKLRPGKVVEASLIGGGLVLFATVAGGWIPGSSWEPYFSLTRNQTIVALVVYGFIAAVLPVWLLLGPRDYLSSFLKIGTVFLLIASVIVANPALAAPKFNEVFSAGGPTFRGNIFPFVFICIMCGAVSGFHALVSSGTTPKMIENELHIRPIGYGAMLCECIVGITALIAAATLPIDLYYDINIPVERAKDFVEPVKKMKQLYAPGASDPMNQNVNDLNHLKLGEVERKVGGESLRGRTGGAVTLAVGMSIIFEQAFAKIGATAEGMLKYWYHFAIMFEALFILTTIDAGTRIGRFLLQETAGRMYEPFSRPDWLPGSLIASAVITGGWGLLIWGGTIDTIWPMFGIANQALAVLALALVTTWIINSGRRRYCWVTLAPMLWVISTTYTAGTQMVFERFPGDMKLAAAKGDHAKELAAGLNIGLTLFVMVSVAAVVLIAAANWLRPRLLPSPPLGERGERNG